MPDGTATPKPRPTAHTGARHPEPPKLTAEDIAAGYKQLLDMRCPGSLFWQEGVPMVSIDLSAVEYGSHAVVGLCGELDVTDAAGVAVALAGVVVCHPNIIIDLTSLEFIDCCGLRAVAGAREQARRAGGDLLLAAPQRLVLRILCPYRPGRGLLRPCQRGGGGGRARSLAGEETVTLALAGAAA